MLKKVIGELDVFPRGYGAAYMDGCGFRWVCYPYGLHIIMGIWRRAFISFRFWYTPNLETKAYLQGWKDRAALMRGR